MKKMPQNRLTKCLKPKKPTLSLKKQFCFKKAYRFIWKKFTEPSSKMPEAKRKNTLIEKTILFQKKLINSYEKNATEPSYKMLEAKNLHAHWKNNSVSKKLINSYDKNATEPSYNIEKTILFQKNLWIHRKKRPQNRLPKCLKPKKQTLSLKKQFCFKKTYKFIWIKATEPYSKMPEAKKKQHFFDKNSLFQTKLINSYEKRPQNRLAKCRKPKNQTLSLKKQFCLKKAYKFIWKKATEPSSKMPEAKKANTFIEKTNLLQKSVQIHMKKWPRTVFQNVWSQKNNHCHWKNNSVWKKLLNSNKKGHRTVFQNAWSQKNKHPH